ncbi:MAG: serine/threonine-protein kinase [Polyangia bacterium]
MAPSLDEDPSILLGRTIAGRYRVESLLGKGGMGAVYRVEHLSIRKPMALKVLSDRMMSVPVVVARFEREAKLAAHLDHPNVVSASDYGKTEDGRYYLVLEYVEGKELREVLDAGPLPPSRALYIARQIASALTRSQALGIVHRDLKPENIMLVRRDGNDDFVKVLDFGLALLSRHLESAGGDEHTAPTAPKITKVGEIFGTPAYMAPEQTIGSATDIRTDLYALGCVLYEMLTGVRPFSGPNALAYIQQHLAVPAPPMKERAPKVQVAADIEAMVMRLLAKQPDDRFQKPEAVIAEIDRLGAVHSLDWPNRSYTSLPPASRPSKSAPSVPAVPLAQRLTEARAGLMRGLGWLRDRILPKRKPKSRIGQAFDTVRKKLGWPRKPKRVLPLWLLWAGGAVLAALLAGALWYALQSGPETSRNAVPVTLRLPERTRSAVVQSRTTGSSARASRSVRRRRPRRCSGPTRRTDRGSCPRSAASSSSRRSGG